MSRRREPVSIVCVWNDEAVRRDCLDRSVTQLQHTAPQTEYVPVDNRDQQHVTAGSALNEGVRAATREFVAFIQQDILLHSLVALEEAAGILADDPRLGLVGAVGIDRDGRLMGLIRDRVVLIGKSCREPATVDSLDEVLFIARRSDLLNDPLSEDPALAWHAYAVEYGLRLRGRGLTVAAVDIPMTHNSRSTNLAGLEDAHAALARLHSDLVPTWTTCGRVVPDRGSREPMLANHRWRLRWLKGSWAARQAKNASGSCNVVLADVRRDIDRIMSLLGVERLRIHNVLAEGLSFPEEPLRTSLRRGARTVDFTTGVVRDVFGLNGDSTEPCVITNLDLEHLRELRVTLQEQPHVMGYNEDTGYWLVVGHAADAVVAAYTSPSSRPARMLV